MPMAGLGMATGVEPRAAVREAVVTALQGLGGEQPDAALVAATAAWGEAALRELVSEVGDRLGCDAWVGGSVDGLLAGGQELAGVPAVAVLVVSGVSAEAILCEALAGDELRAGAEIAAGRIAADPRPGDLLLVLVDSLGLAPGPLIRGLDSALAPTRIVGLGATEPAGASALVWAGGRVARESCAALLIRAPAPPRLAVTNGCRARSGLVTVSRVRDNWILGLDGAPALDAYLRALPESLRAGPHHSTRGLLVAVAPEGLDPGAVGPAGEPISGLLVRNIVGFDEERGAFALPLPLARGSKLAFVCLDAEAARADLAYKLDSLEPESAAFGCLLSCRTRGEALFEHAGVESGYLERALRDRPVLGLSGAYQLAPELGSGRTLLHTYAGVIAFFAA